MRSDWETILKFNRQQAALGKPQIPVGRLNQMQPPEVPKLRMEKVQHPVVYPSSTRVEVGRPLIEVGPNEEVYPSPERATEWNLAQQQMRMAAQPDSEPSSQTVSSGTGTLETSTSGQQSLESSSSWEADNACASKEFDYGTRLCATALVEATIQTSAAHGKCGIQQQQWWSFSFEADVQNAAASAEGSDGGLPAEA